MLPGVNHLPGRTNQKWQLYSLGPKWRVPYTFCNLLIYAWFICLIVKRIHAFCVLNTFTMFYLSLILVLSEKYWVKRFLNSSLHLFPTIPLPHLNSIQFMKISDLMIKLYQTLSIEIELQYYCSRCTQA